jgi:hypothetical protein
MRVVPDHRIAGMVTYPLDEILLATLVGSFAGPTTGRRSRRSPRGGGGLAALPVLRVAFRRRRLFARCFA